MRIRKDHTYYYNSLEIFFSDFKIATCTGISINFLSDLTLLVFCTFLVNLCSTLSGGGK